MYRRCEHLNILAHDDAMARKCFPYYQPFAKECFQPVRLFPLQMQVI